MVSRTAAAIATGAAGSTLLFAPTVLVVLVVAGFLAFLIPAFVAIRYPTVLAIIAVLRGDASLRAQLQQVHANCGGKCNKQHPGRTANCLRTRIVPHRSHKRTVGTELP